jgi:hypothetical protein
MLVKKGQPLPNLKYHKRLQQPSGRPRTWASN